MKIIRGIFLLFLLPGSAIAANPCVVPGSAVELEMTRKMLEDTGLTAAVSGLPIMEQLAETPVSQPLALQYAAASRTRDQLRLGDIVLTLDDYFSTFYDYHAVNLVVKYTYLSPDSKKIFLSGLPWLTKKSAPSVLTAISRCSVSSELTEMS